MRGNSASTTGPLLVEFRFGIDLQLTLYGLIDVDLVLDDDKTS